MSEPRIDAEHFLNRVDAFAGIGATPKEMSTGRHFRRRTGARDAF